ncbi:MAG: PAS domain-containing protein [Gemmatirosa sp.]|nr:PAS domain-containing protein [Gemmatirosa sp.]
MLLITGSPLLERRAPRLAALAASGLLDAPPSAALDRLTRLAARLLGVPTAVVSLVDAERQFFASAVGVAEPWATRRGTPLSHSFCQHVVASGAPLVVEDAPQHPLVCDNLAIPDLGVIAYAGVPLRTSAGHVFGSLCAIDSTPHAWTDDDLATLTDLAGAAVTELELRATTRVLASTSGNFRELLDTTTELVCTAGPDGRVTYANHAWLAALGYTLDEAIGTPAADLVTPADRERFLESARQLHAGEPIEDFEAVLVGRDGQRVVCRGRAAADMVDDAMAPNGRRCIGTRAVYRDLTTERHAEATRLRAEEALRRSETQLAAIVDHAAIGITVIAPDGTLVSANAAFHAFLGYPDGTLVGRYAPSLSPDEDAEVTRAPIADLRAGRVSRVTVAKRFVRADGVVRVGELTATLVPLPAGQMGVLGIIVDVTERRAAEAALEASEARYRTAIEGSLDAFMALHSVRDASGAIVDFEVVEASTRAAAMVQMPREDLVGQRLCELFPLARSRGHFARYVEVVETRTTAEWEIEPVDPRVVASVVWMQAVPLEDGFALSLRDVTAQHVAARALREREARLSLIYDSATDLMFLMRVERAKGMPDAYRCESVNAAYLEVTGLTADRIIGREVGDILPPDAAREATARYDRAARTGDVLRYEEDVHLPTAHITVETTLTPVFDDRGTCTHLLGVARDVTAQKAAEAALRDSEARVRGAVEASLDALFVFHHAGTDFVIADCNAQAGALATRPRAALLGGSITHVFPDAHAHGLVAACERVAASGAPYETEHCFEGAGRSATWVRLQVVQVGDGVAITARDITEQKQAEEALRVLALVDELTGAYNRRGFLAMAEREWQRAVRDHHGAILVYIDLNDFKDINDTYGHAEGDAALRATCDVLRTAFRGADVIGRLGGDEFAVLVVPMGGQDMAIAEPAIRDRLAQQLAAANDAARRAGRPYDLSMSVGIARMASGLTAPASVTTLMVEADERLYEEKRARRAVES